MVRITRQSCEAQFDHIFYGHGTSPAWQMQSWHESWWQFVCVWVGVYMHLQGEKRKEIMKEKHSHKDSAQNNKVAMCTQALWLWLYLPLFPVSPPCLLHRFISPLITALSFYRPHSFCGSTRTQTLSVCFLLLSFFPSLPGYHLDFDLHHRLAHPFPLSCSSFAVDLSSSPVHLMSLYLCSCGFLPLLTYLSFLIWTHPHIPDFSFFHITSSKQRFENKFEFGIILKFSLTLHKAVWNRHSYQISHLSL